MAKSTKARPRSVLRKPRVAVSSRLPAAKVAVKKKTAMSLHRDIYWVGKQWAVTGYGIQACDQKQKGKFDIKASRLWEDGVLDSLRAEKWLNAEDLENALAAARKYYPEPPRKAAPPKQVVSAPVERPIEPPKPAPHEFNMRVERWSAKFQTTWRVRFNR